jgi:hypothetical protein
MWSPCYPRVRWKKHLLLENPFTNGRRRKVEDLFDDEVGMKERGLFIPLS